MTKKRILSLLCLILFLVIGRSFILYLIEPVDYSIFFNRTLKDSAHKNGGQLDMVFLGSSRPQRTFDPVVFEETLGLDWIFNASSGLQPIESSYYMLRELISRYHPRYVVLGVTAGTLFNDNSALAKMIVLDRLHGLNKLEYLRNCFNKNELLNAASRIYRFRNNFNAEKIQEITAEKSLLRQNGYAERWDPPDMYRSNGFVYSYHTGDIGNMTDESMNFEKIRPKNLEYLKKFVELCAEHDIRLFLVTPPCSMMNIYHLDNYQEFTDFFTEFADENGLNYINLNYLRGREDWLGDALMYDSGHVNGEGAELVSEKYAQVLKAILDETDGPDLFYTDVNALKADVHRIIAVGARISIVDLKATVHISSRQTEGIEPLFRIQISTDGENFTPLTDWSAETDYVLDLSARRGTAHFLIEAMSPTGETGVSVTYEIPI